MAVHAFAAKKSQLYQLEAGEDEYQFAIRFGGLKENQTGNKRAVNAALGRLLRRALTALLHESERQR